jgi:hypothetical protein
VVFLKIKENLKIQKKKKQFFTRHQKLTPAILATCKAESGRTMIQDQSGKKFMRPIAGFGVAHLMS